MDVTPQSLKDVEFRQALRGYDPDEVDMFLQRVSAGVAQLQGRLSEAISRAEAAEARIDRGDAAPPTRRARREGEPSEQTITRTLLLAQQTADKLLTEAREEASSTLSQVQNEAAEVRGEAQAEAEELRRVAKQETDELRVTAKTETDELRSLTESETSKQRRTTQSEVDALLLEAEHASSKAAVEAEAERNAILSEVESEARAVAEATRTPLLAEIRDLENRRDFLAEDVALLEHHVDAERSLVLESIGRLQSAVDEPDALRVSPVPQLSRYSKLEERPAEVKETPSTEAASGEDVADVSAEPSTAAAGEPALDLTDHDEQPAPVADDLADFGVEDVGVEDAGVEEVAVENVAAEGVGAMDLSEAPDADAGADQPEAPDVELATAEDAAEETISLTETDINSEIESNIDSETDPDADTGGGSGPGIAKPAAAVVGGAAVASATSGSFIDNFGAATTTTKPSTADSSDAPTDLTDSLSDDLVVEESADDAAIPDNPVDAAIPVGAADGEDAVAESSPSDVMDFERTPIADDLGFVEPDDSVSGATGPSAELFDHESQDSEDSVLPVFDDDDFFGTTAGDAVSDVQPEVIDLTTDASTGSSMAKGSSVDEPTQAFSVAADPAPGAEPLDGSTAASAMAQSDPTLDGEEPTGDAFLEELRRAVSEDDGASDDDPALVAFFDDDSDGPTKRFGRQR